MSNNRRAIIVHGWNDSPENAWMQWLKRELEGRGFNVIAPVLPHAHVPRLGRWVNLLREATGKLNENTVIVAHSLGTPTVLRLLNDYGEDVQIAGLVLVAGFGAGFRNIPASLFNPPLDFNRIASRARIRVCIYSDNDHTVPPSMSKQLAVWLGARETVVLGAGHFLGGKVFPTAIDKLPAALEAVLSCYKLTFRERIARLLRMRKN
jgi:predicted alpha/beta hydrolase family esterase